MRSPLSGACLTQIQNSQTPGKAILAIGGFNPGIRFYETSLHVLNDHPEKKVFIYGFARDPFPPVTIPEYF